MLISFQCCCCCVKRHPFLAFRSTGSSKFLWYVVTIYAVVLPSSSPRDGRANGAWKTLGYLLWVSLSARAWYDRSGKPQGGPVPVLCSSLLLKIHLPHRTEWRNTADTKAFALFLINIFLPHMYSYPMQYSKRSYAHRRALFCYPKWTKCNDFCNHQRNWSETEQTVGSHAYTKLTWYHLSSSKPYVNQPTQVLDL